ncbi:MAG: YbbR-like domain-containing protein [Planctomycetota bacterium]|jgi:hypothetical protein
MNKATPLPPARTPPPRTRGRGATARWLTSSWGLSILALILAVLIWAVVRRDIEVTEERLVRVVPVVESPDRFQAFAEKEVNLVLRGPSGEVEDALREFGADPTVTVRISDLKPGLDYDFIEITELRRFGFDVRRRIVASIEPVNVGVYRVLDYQVRVTAPPLEGVPNGIGAQVTLIPPVISVRGPANKVGQQITADVIDLAPYFERLPEGLVPPAKEIPLRFSGWRDDKENAAYRQRVEIEDVIARIEFSTEKVQLITNRYWILVDEGYVVTLDNPPEQLNEAKREYTGRFEGWSQDLAALASDLDAWHFAIVVKRDQYPAEGEEERDIKLPIQAVLLKRPHVRLAPVEGAGFVFAKIRRKPE